MSKLKEKAERFGVCCQSCLKISEIFVGLDEKGTPQVENDCPNCGGRAITMVMGNIFNFVYPLMKEVKELRKKLDLDKQTNSGASFDKIWDDDKVYWDNQRISKMKNGEMLAEFHEAFEVVKDQDGILLQHKLIAEEYYEFLGAYGCENKLKEMADLVYVIYGLADRLGWDLDEAIKRVHISNMNKLDEDGYPIRREDGKILKGSNYKEPDLSDLVV